MGRCGPALIVYQKMRVRARRRGDTAAVARPPTLPAKVKGGVWGGGPLARSGRRSRPLEGGVRVAKGRREGPTWEGTFAMHPPEVPPSPFKGPLLQIARLTRELQQPGWARPGYLYPLERISPLVGFSSLSGHRTSAGRVRTHGPTELSLSLRSRGTRLPRAAQGRLLWCLLPQSRITSRSYWSLRQDPQHPRRLQAPQTRR